MKKTLLDALKLLFIYSWFYFSIVLIGGFTLDWKIFFGWFGLVAGAVWLITNFARLISLTS